MRTGTVKWFNAIKGYGLITPSDGSDVVFVYYPCIEGDGFKALCGGQQVCYEAVSGSSGLLEATRVITV